MSEERISIGKAAILFLSAALVTAVLLILATAWSSHREVQRKSEANEIEDHQDEIRVAMLELFVHDGDNGSTVKSFRVGRKNYAFISTVIDVRNTHCRNFEAYNIIGWNMDRTPVIDDTLVTAASTCSFSF